MYRSTLLGGFPLTPGSIFSERCRILMRLRNLLWKDSRYVGPLWDIEVCTEDRFHCIDRRPLICGFYPNPPESYSLTFPSHHGITVEPVTRGHLNKCSYMTGVPSSQVHFNVEVHFSSQKMQFRHLDRCPLVTGFTIQWTLSSKDTLISRIKCPNMTGVH